MLAKLLTLQSSYMRGASTPVFGAAHGTDLLEFLGLGNQTDFIAVDSISKLLWVQISEDRLVDQVGQSILLINETRTHPRIRSAFSGTSLGRSGHHVKKNLLF